MCKSWLGICQPTTRSIAIRDADRDVRGEPEHPAREGTGGVVDRGRQDTRDGCNGCVDLVIALVGQVLRQLRTLRVTADYRAGACRAGLLERQLPWHVLDDLWRVDLHTAGDDRLTRLDSGVEAALRLGAGLRLDITLRIDEGGRL